MLTMDTQAEIKGSFKLLVLSTLLTLALWFIPFADLITYPIRIFVTYIHEAGHALAALASFGAVNRIALDWGGSGVTETVGGAGFLISSAGYLSTTLYGSSLLLLLRRKRNARSAALGTGILLLAMTVLFGGNLFAWMAGLTLGAGCLLIALKARPGLTHFMMSFLAIQCLLNAIYDLFTLMYLSAFAPAYRTDAQNMAEATGGLIPAIAWAVGWSLLSTAILVTTLVIYYRSLRHRAALAETPPAGFISDFSRDMAEPRL